MKQHITLEQFYELSNNRKLLKIIDPKGAGGQVCITDEMRIQWLTIGKMIEILNQDHQMTLYENYKDGWSVVLYKKDSNKFAFDYYSHKDNLCDALWEAVKQIL